MTDPDRTLDRLRHLPVAERLAAALAGVPAFLVGGTVRDALLGEDADELDVCFDADPERVLTALEGLGPLRRHDRFGTATLEIGGGRVDLARTRSETYERPGALPDVAPASLEDDLRRRDFSVNAMALPLAGDGGGLIDPLGGRADLDRRQLRILHPRSFLDDPTRAIRAARYCSRLGLRLEERTEEAIGTADLSLVSAERAEAELGRLAAEPEPLEALRLLDRWGVLSVPAPRLALAGTLLELLEGSPPWRQETAQPAALRLAAWAPGGELEPSLALAAEPQPLRPSEACVRARALSGPQLAVARAAGAEWLDRYLDQWRGVRAAIDGDDLLAAGIEEGPALGRALAATRAALLDGELGPGREEQLDFALGVAAEAERG
jgi:tRNA nucleotidyltransferase (CCA-adding enzyme)